MMYTIKTSGSFEKDFSKLDSSLQSRVLSVVERMRTNPFFAAKKLKDLEYGKFRIRIGDYRLRFDIVSRDIYLYRIRHRREVYRR